MAAKKSTDVMIAGKVYTLSGYEEEGYLQHVASYINTKISEITEREEFRRIPNDMKSILIQLNIADDFFKAKKQYETAEENYKKAEKDLFELKHELVDTQMKVEELLEKLNRERQERNQKSDRESRLEEDYRKLQEKYQLLASNAKVADERNRQFEEMLRLTQQEKREVEAVNKELRLNKEKLESTLADALLGTVSAAEKPSGNIRPEPEKPPAGKGQPEPKEPPAGEAIEEKEQEAAGNDGGQEPIPEESEEFLTPTELPKEEINELREAIHETMAELAMEDMAAAQPVPLDGKDGQEPLEPLDTEGGPEHLDPPEGKDGQEPLRMQDAEPEHLDSLEAEPEQPDSLKPEPEQPRSQILLTPGLSEEELAELLGPVREPQPAMAELSKEELEELLAPIARHEITDEGPLPEPDDEEDFIPSVMSEVSEDDDPEIKELAWQIAELERQEQAEKIKKKPKKNKKRKR